MPEVPVDGPPPSFLLAKPEKQTAGKAETARNPRSRSAKLRMAIRTEAPPHERGSVML